MKINKFYDTLKNKGYKLTPQRIIVYDTLVEQKDKHLTIEELYNFVKLKDKTVGLTTVYRTVQLFCDLKLLDKMTLDDNIIRYEILIEGGVHRHHHLICNNCNKIIEVREDLLESIENLFESNYGFKVIDHQTKFYGLCEECSNKE
ncbi:MAG: Fur family transcriptional regulator [Lachnospirales bacterium]